MNELFTDKIKLAFRSSQYHIQGIIPYHILEDIASNLFNLQNKGVFIELIVLMDNEIKSIKTTNTLLRISAGGGQIFTYCDLENTTIFFLNFDKKISISNEEINEEPKQDIQSSIKKGILVFQNLKEKATPVIHQSGCPEISFTASNEWVKCGDKINLIWEVAQGQSVHLLPQDLSLPLKGSIEVQINTDSLFTIQVKNENLTVEKRIFVKSLTSYGLNFSVQILTNNLNTFIPLEAHPEIPFHYAIPPNCDIRLNWEADKMGILKEEKWGELPVNGYRDIQFKEDTILDFTWKTIFEIKKINLHFYIMREKRMPEIPKKEKTIHPIFRLFKKRR